MASEKRLIDANALLERVRTQDRIVFFTQRSGKIYEAFKQFLAELLKYTPTVDAMEVVHGRWVFGTANHREYMKCSVCLKSQTPTGVFTYCPNCGAKMDGGNEDA